MPKSRMAEVLAASDACIAILKPLDLYKTTYPNKVFDYMAAGRPVVLAIDGVIREVWKRLGEVLPFHRVTSHAMAQAIRALAADPRRSRTMGLAGRRCIEEEFNRSILADKLILLLEEMEKKHGLKKSWWWTMRSPC
jgi:glycosyltransferase involved in cell wall biosynthesis